MQSTGRLSCPAQGARATAPPGSEGTASPALANQDLAMESFHFAEWFCAAGSPSACLEGFTPSCSSKTGFLFCKAMPGKKNTTPFSFSASCFFLILMKMGICLFCGVVSVFFVFYFKHVFSPTWKRDFHFLARSVWKDSNRIDDVRA